MPEIDLVHVARQFAILGICGGFIGAAIWHLLVGSLHALALHLHARMARRQRIAMARVRASEG